MHKTTVDIICPNCRKKAVLYTELLGFYVFYPNQNGKVICSHCGLNNNYQFSKKDYYYQIPVGSRTLYARNLENLIIIKQCFEQGHLPKFKNTEPSTDFPKVFYKRKDEIVKKINGIIEKENR